MFDIYNHGGGVDFSCLQCGFVDYGPHYKTLALLDEDRADNISRRLRDELPRIALPRFQIERYKPVLL